MSKATAPSDDTHGRPDSADYPTLSRKRAREWWWTQHDRAAYRCPDCDRGRDRIYQFEVHHKDGDPLNNDPSNLVALCHRCHIWRHSDSPSLSGLDVHEWQEAFVDGV